MGLGREKNIWAPYMLEPLIIISSNPHFEVGEISLFVDEEMNE